MTDTMLRVEGEVAKPRRTGGQFAQPGRDDSAAYAADSGSAPVAGDSLAMVQALAQELINEETAVARAEAQLKAAQKRLADVQEHRLPDLMQAHGLDKFEFVDRVTRRSYVIEFESKWRVGLPPLKDKDGHPYVDAPAQRRAIFDWLRERGLAGIIRKNIELNVGLLPDSLVEMMVKVLKMEYQNIDIDVAQDIHPSTLTAQVRRMLDADENVHENLQVTPIRRAKVKQPKG